MKYYLKDLLSELHTISFELVDSDRLKITAVLYPLSETYSFEFDLEGIETIEAMRCMLEDFTRSLVLNDCDIKRIEDQAFCICQNAEVHFELFLNVMTG